MILRLFFAATVVICVNGRRQGKIVGGDIINIDQAPFMVSLEYLEEQICGGAILTEDWAITASHCFGNIFLSSQAVLRVGSGLRGQGGSVHSVQEIIKHPDFVLRVNDKDVALLKAYPKFEFSSYVQPIQISTAYLTPQIGEYMTVFGYGYTKETGDPSQFLRYVHLPVFPHDECASVYRTVLNVTWQMICCGFREGGRDACVLDSGGPLVWQNSLYGLVSWGYGCARVLRPGVFTDLTSPPIREWIRSIVQI